MHPQKPFGDTHDLKHGGTMKSLPALDILCTTAHDHIKVDDLAGMDALRLTVEQGTRRNSAATILTRESAEALKAFLTRWLDR
jgi:hypothetical protein